MEEDKAIGLKIVPKEEKFWVDLKEKLIKDIELAKNEIIVNENLVALCNSKITS